MATTYQKLKAKPKLPKCATCPRRPSIYVDRVAATLDGQKLGQLAFPCPKGNGWHLTKRERT